MTTRWLVIVGVIMEAAYLSFYLLPESPREVLLLIGVHVFVFLLLALTWWKSGAANAEPGTTRLVVGFAILFRLTLVLHPPVGSDDIYRYVWDGKVAASGINPFAFAPADSALAHLHTTDLPSKINFPTMRTIYPPLAQGVFFVSQLLFGDSLAGLKFLLVLADIVSVLLLYRLFNAPLQGLLLYAWSPLPILYFGLDGHVDALGIPFLLLSLYLLQRGNLLKGAVSLGFAALSKLYPLLVVPFVFHLTKGWKKIALPAVPIVLLMIGCWLYWEPTGGLIESFIIFNTTFEFNGSVFHLIYALVGSNEKAHLVSSVVFLIWWATVFALNRTFLERVFLAFVGFIVCAPTVHPWYLTWLAALVVLRWSPAVSVLLGFSVISNWVVYQYRLSGVWRADTLLLLVEYIPFYVLLVREVVRGTFSLRQASAKIGG